MEHDPPAVVGDYFFVRRPIVAIVISIVTVIGGLVAMGGLPIAQYPDIVPPEIKVDATYTGADAVTIEQSVATPIEQQVNGVDYMIYLRSVNANDGTMSLRVSFEVGDEHRHGQRAGAEPREPGGRQPAHRRTQLRRHRQEVDLQPAADLFALLAERQLRGSLPRQLREHQHHRRAEAGPRRRRRDPVRHQRLRDADLGEAGPAREPRPHRPRSGGRDPEAERGEPVGQGGRRAGARRARSSPGACAPRGASSPPRSSATWWSARIPPAR